MNSRQTTSLSIAEEEESGMVKTVGGVVVVWPKWKWRRKEEEKEEEEEE